jgi:hypothetical protein
MHGVVWLWWCETMRLEGSWSHLPSLTSAGVSRFGRPCGSTRASSTASRPSTTLLATTEARRKQLRTALHGRRRAGGRAAWKWWARHAAAAGLRGTQRLVPRPRGLGRRLLLPVLRSRPRARGGRRGGRRRWQRWTIRWTAPCGCSGSGPSGAAVTRTTPAQPTHGA